MTKTDWLTKQSFQMTITSKRRSFTKFSYNLFFFFKKLKGRCTQSCRKFPFAILCYWRFGQKFPKFNFRVLKNQFFCNVCYTFVCCKTILYNMRRYSFTIKESKLCKNINFWKNKQILIKFRRRNLPGELLVRRSN